MTTAKHLTLTAFTTLTCLLIASVAMAQDLEVLSGSKEVAVDAKKSSIKFVSEAPAEKIEGTVESGISGSFKLNADDVSKTSGTIALPVEEMSTGNKLRDKHMRGKDWLNAKDNANITFTIDGLDDVKMGKKEGDKQSFDALAKGKVNINGTNAPASAKVTVTALGSGSVKVEIKQLVVKLADHKVEGKKGVVGDKVGETIEITGLIYGAAK